MQRLIDSERRHLVTVVTSRPSGFPRRLTTGRHAELYHLAGLGSDGRKDLINRYLRALGRTDLTNRLVTQVETNRDLWELAGNPFMLGLLVQASVAGVSELSHEWTLSELYDSATSWTIAALQERDVQHAVALSRSISGLGRLSHRLLFEESPARYVFFGDELMRELTPEQANAVERSRFVGHVGPVGSSFAFTHATFQEYFAATHCESVSDEELDAVLETAFRSAARSIVLEFTVGSTGRAGRACRARLDRWLTGQDRYGQVLLQVARLLAACRKDQRPGPIVARVFKELWESTLRTRNLDRKRLGIGLLARLDPVGLCSAAREARIGDQFVVDCIASCVPPSVGKSQRIVDLMNPSMRERVETELWGGPSGEQVKANRDLLQATEDIDELRSAVLFAGASRDAGAVALLETRLRAGGLTDELEQEISTSLGQIGGKAATRTLVDLVVGDIPASYVAAGMARRALQHTDSAYSRLDPEGRDKLLRRIACAPADHSRQLMMLSALRGFPTRVGTRLLKYWACSAAIPAGIRIDCLQAIEPSLSRQELGHLVDRIDGQPKEFEAQLLAFAVQRQHDLPIHWLDERLCASTQLKDKQKYLTGALVMSMRDETPSLAADVLLSNSVRNALAEAGSLEHVVLAPAFRRALDHMTIEHSRPPRWVDESLTRRVLEDFCRRGSAWSADQVMLAASLLGRIPTPESEQLLHKALGACRQRMELSQDEMQKRQLNEVGRSLAKSIASLFPQRLLLYPSQWEPVDAALSDLSVRRGWTIFDDRIIDVDGASVTPPWSEEVPAEPPQGEVRDTISNQDLLLILRDKFAERIDLASAAGFSNKMLNSPRALSDYLNNLAIPDVDAALAEQEGTSERQESVRLDGGPLRVHRDKLLRALDGSDQLLRQLFADAQIGSVYMPFLADDFPDAVFVCPACAAVHSPVRLPDDWWMHSGEFIFRPNSCLACRKHKYKTAWTPSQLPARILWCQHCAAPYDENFLATLRTGTPDWHCESTKCKPKHPDRAVLRRAKPRHAEFL